jgi:hypothetical protein
MNEMQMKLRISYDKTHHTSSRANARATLLVLFIEAAHLTRIFSTCHRSGLLEWHSVELRAQPTFGCSRQGQRI